MGRLHRLSVLVQARSQSFARLIEAGTVAEILDWGQNHPIVGFNGSALRLRIAYELSQGSRPPICETGSYHAATAITARRCLGLEVLTCERDWKRAVVAKSLTMGMKGVAVGKKDSRSFLICIADQLIGAGVGVRPFFYLDAHGGRCVQELPLLDELRSVSRFPEFVALIDDFAVPEASFTYDTWHSRPLAIDLISDLLSAEGIDRVLFPSYAPFAEGGLHLGRLCCNRPIHRGRIDQGS
jgi:hypothetical protein